MKKMYFIFVGITMSAAAMFTSCKGGQQVAQQQTKAQTTAFSASAQPAVDDEVAAIERETKLIQARTNLELAKRDSELRLAQTHQVNTTLEWNPCMQQSVGVSNDVLLGFGLSDQQRDRTEALLNANTVATADIASRFVGVLKNGLERYADQGYTESGIRLDQSSLEGYASNAGKNAVNKMAQVTCREIGTDNKTGMFVGYVAVQVPLKETVDEAQKELEKAGLKVDKIRMRDFVNSELEKENQQRNEEINALRESRGL